MMERIATTNNQKDFVLVHPLVDITLYRKEVNRYCRHHIF